MTKRAILAGGAGFLGRALARDLASAGWEVVVLSRRAAAPVGAMRTVVWDGLTPTGWAGELEGADAIVNLAGRSIACVHNPTNRREILDSRVDSVRAITSALAGCARPPPVWIQAASLGIYGNPGDRVCDESAPPSADFSARVCKAWEEAFFSGAALSGRPRRVALRIGIVLGPGGGGLAPLVRLARCYLGGAAGSGRQFVSWIELSDFCALCRWTIDHESARGVYNATGPIPTTNADFMRELRRVLGRPWCPPAPAWAVRFGARLVMKVDGDLALTGRRCVPRRLTEEGFVFKNPDLAPVLSEILGPGAERAARQKKV